MPTRPCPAEQRIWHHRPHHFGLPTAADGVRVPISLDQMISGFILSGA